jgi:hypothetical protein
MGVKRCWFEGVVRHEGWRGTRSRGAESGGRATGKAGEGERRRVVGEEIKRISRGAR